MEILGGHMKRAILCTIMVAVLLQSEETDEVLSLMSLDELMTMTVKTGSFLELELRKTPFSMTVIDKDHIDSYGGRTLSDLLEMYVPGFQYMANKWNGTLWGMRGVAGDRNDKIVVLIDGVKQNFQSYQGFATEYSLGLMSDIERIEVLRGSAGLVYGSGAIAGIVNIVTKDATMKNYGSIKTEYRTENGFGGVIAEGGFSATPKDGHTLVVNAGYKKSKGIGEYETKVFGLYEMGSKPIHADGYITAGSYGETDGNWLASLKYGINNFKLYTRITRQIDQVAPLFLPAPWITTPDSNNLTTWINEEKYVFNKSDNYHHGWVPHRRMHLRDNVTLAMNYDQPIGLNNLQVQTSLIGSTNRIVNREYGDQLDTILTSNGERKFNIGATYLLKQVQHLQVGSGITLGIFNAGDDLSGQNRYWVPGVPYIKDVTYYNFAAYTEILYKFSPLFSTQAGVRWDLYTDRGDRIDGVGSPKIALLFEPSKKHLIKLIAQSSSNNPDVLTLELAPEVKTKEKDWTYEWGYTYGKNALDTLSLAKLQSLLGRLQSPVSEKEKHATKPERSYDIELATQHLLTKKILLETSIDYAMFRDLLLWSSAMQQNIPIDAYDALSFELGMKGDFKKISLGCNGALQLPMNFDNKPTKLYTRAKFVPGWNETVQGWVPVDTMPNGTATGDTTIYQDITKFQVSADGTYFNNLHTLTTKGYVKWSPAEFVTLTTNGRVFWGLLGRKVLHDTLVAQSSGNVELFNQAGESPFRPTVKWDASVAFNLPKSTTLSIYGYNLLGKKDNQDAVRWQQMTAASQNEYYTLDQRSFAVKCTKEF